MRREARGTWSWRGGSRGASDPSTTRCASCTGRRGALPRRFPRPGRVWAGRGRGPGTADLDGLEAALAFDLEVSLPDDVLFRLDVAANGRDVRTPFVDVDLAQTVVPPPWREKLGRLHVRRLLREAVADLLPRDVLIRPPRPPSVPIGAWLRGPLRQMLHDLVRAPTARIRTLLDPRAIDRALAQSLAPRGNPQQAWTLLCLELWARAQRG